MRWPMVMRRSVPLEEAALYQWVDILQCTETNQVQKNTFSEIPPGGVYKYTRDCGSADEEDTCDEEVTDGGVKYSYVTTNMKIRCASDN